jgi:PAS domain S-box-containing protein
MPETPQAPGPWRAALRRLLPWRHARSADADALARIEDLGRRLKGETAERERLAAALKTSEDFLHSLLDHLPVNIFRLDAEERFTFVNSLFCQRRGRSPEEILGKTPGEISPAGLVGQYRETNRQVLQEGIRYNAIEENITATGEKRWLHTIKVPIHDETGRRVGLQAMFFDVTEHRRAEAALTEAGNLLDAMLRNSDNIIYFKDISSRFVRMSDAFLHRFGLKDPGQLEGKTDFDLFTPEHAQPAFDDEREIIRTGCPLNDKLEKETFPDGRVAWVLTSKMPWRDRSGAIIGTLGISKDVTALKETEAQLAYERDLLGVLLESSPDAIYFKDHQSRFLRVSRSAAAHLFTRMPGLRERLLAERGSPSGDAVPDDTALMQGLTDADIYSPENARRTLEDEQSILRTGHPLVGNLQKMTMLDGSVCWLLTNKMPWRDATGAIIGIVGISRDITALKTAEEQLEQANRRLMDTSRQAGMAEVATSVLHNVGNVLNSVNVSATLAADHVRRSKVSSVVKLRDLLHQHRDDLGRFLTEDPKGRMIPTYLDSLAESLAGEQARVLAELEALRKNVDHIKDIVAMQQNYAKTSGVTETVSVPDLVEDALRMNAGSLARHDVEIVRDYADRPVVTTDKHKVLQILVNLIRNAKYACDESGRTDKFITLRTTADETGVDIAVSDNGVGIPAENLTRIFAHGFTTRKHGHGFGLHSGALAARDLGGSLAAHSDGPGKGATFTLRLPVLPSTTS